MSDTVSLEKETQTVIEAHNIKKYFKVKNGFLHAVDDVSFHINNGKTLGVVGESGCGKSTLGRTMIRLIEPTAGEMLFHGEDLFKMNKKSMRTMKQRLNIIFQDPYSSLDPRMTVAGSIAEPMRLNHMYSGKAEMERRVHELMDIVGLSSRVYSSYPHELDGGRRQRVGVARTLAVNPQFIVCDEPVSALDVSIQAQILNLLMDLQDQMGLTYMFITHNLSVVRHISQDVLVMYCGKCVEYCSCDELFANPIHPYTKALLDAIPSPTASGIGKEPKLLRGEVASPINPKPGCRFASRCDFATEKCRSCDIPFVDVGNSHYVACIYAK